MWYVIALIVLELILLATNYIPGTFLVGWDNVMPEFNIGLNIKRSLFSLWQEYRGLGLVDGMAHSANLLHTLYISLLNTLLPESLVRYLYIHITHLAGGLGFFFLARKLCKNSLASFLGALFYMFNIGVIQMYYAPLEVFATHFAALPILALTTFNALTHTTYKNLLILFVSALLLSPQAFVPTVFIAYALVLLFQLVFSLLRGKSRSQSKKLRVKYVLFIGLTVFLANAYWMLPYAYSAIKTPQVIAESRINQFSSEEIFYRNKARGDILSTLTFKGFMLDTVEYDQQNKDYFDFMGTWNRHIHSVPGMITSIFLMLVSVTGIVLIVIKKERKMYPFIAAGAIAFFFLANNTPILAQLNDIVRNTLPLIGEAFRFPFTKFITLFAFCMALFFTYALTHLRLKSLFFRNILLTGVSVAILFMAYPTVRGFFTSPALRLQIPEYYQQTFSYFQTQPADRRVALLPAETFWNWGYTSWGHRGSGFIWHGIPQSILMRPFDPWSLANEQFYNELSYALSIDDPTLFSQVLRKYDVHYLLLDESIINPLSTQPINYDEIREFLSKVEGVVHSRTFGEIAIYTTPATTSPVYSIDQKNTVTAYPEFETAKQDMIFSLIGNYVNTTTNPDVYTPLPSLSTDRLPDSSEVLVTQNDQFITITPRNTPNITIPNGKLVMPSLLQDEFLIPVSVEAQGSNLTLTFVNPIISINNKTISYPAHTITLPTGLQDIISVKFADIDHTVDIRQPSRYSYLLNTTATSVVVSNGTQEESFVIDMSQENQTPIVVDLPDTNISNFSVSFPRFESTLSENNVLETDTYTITENQNRSDIVPPVTSEARDGTTIAFTAQNSTKELAFYKPSLYHQASYLLFINSRHKQGLPVNFYIDNPFRSKAILETKLSKQDPQSTILLPKTEQFFQGYGFHVIVKSVGVEIAEAEISNISLYPAPLETLKGIRIADTTNPVFATISADKVTLAYKKSGFSTYHISDASESSIVTLSQSKDTGWRAYSVDKESFIQKTFPFLGTPLQDVTVNNWANGWLMNDTNRSTSIIFLPSILQLSGQALTFISFLGLLFLSVRSRFSKSRITDH